MSWERVGVTLVRCVSFLEFEAIEKYLRKDTDMEYNIYCDESCHLEHDDSNAMTIGAIWMPKDISAKVSNDIKNIKVKHGVPICRELKWSKISPSSLSLYKDLVRYFFDSSYLNFRCILIKDKTRLDHKKYNQTHNNWYDKMYYDMLKHILKTSNQYYVYVDYKDTHSHYNSSILLKYLRSEKHDNDAKSIKRVQPIRSDEVQVMQLVDILIGAVAMKNRHFDNTVHRSSAKLEVAQLIAQLSGSNLSDSSSYSEKKFNIFSWVPDYKEGVHND